MVSDADIDVVLQVLRKISPADESHLQIDSSNIKKHPEIEKVLDNHTRGSSYFRRFFSDRELPITIAFLA
jgi:hypothetical protein